MNNRGTLWTARTGYQIVTSSPRANLLGYQLRTSLYYFVLLETKELTLSLLLLLRTLICSRQEFVITSTKGQYKHILFQLLETTTSWQVKYIS